MSRQKKADKNPNTKDWPKVKGKIFDVNEMRKAYENKMVRELEYLPITHKTTAKKKN